ncbi:ABC transporter substrate-binding protein [Streptomyces sp. NPDC026672]|uniref:ABC transporter substrate-binding protein n=1 Tax=unclassified Streptomyces TaxID=2593676 RepID=UPI0033C2CC66
MRSRREVLGVLGAGGAVVAGLAGCSSSGRDRRPSGTLTLGTAVDVNSFAPAEAQDAHFMQYYQAPYDGLLRIAPDGTYTPGLATEWSYDRSRTVLHLTLRPGVRFHDGTPFDGRAVAANLMAAKKGTGTGAAGFASLRSVRVDSPGGVDLVLERPDPGIVRQLAMGCGMMASPKAVGTPGLRTRPVGTGPYVLDPKGTTPTVKYTFVRNADYWDKRSFPFEKVVLIPMTDAIARLNAVRSGQVDGAFGDALNIRAATSAGLKATVSPGPGFQGLFLFDRDGRVSRPLGDVRVRRAVNHAMDRDGIAKILVDGRARTTGQVFNPQSPAADLSLDTYYPHDPARARTLLAQAGYARGFDLDIPEPVYPNLSPILGQLLGDVGIRVNWVQVPTQSVNAQYLSGKFPAVYYQLQSSDPWQAVNFLGTAKAAWNPLHVDDPAVQAAIDAVRDAPEGAARDAAYHRLDRVYVERAWFAPAYFPDAVYFSSPAIEVTPQSLQIVPSLQNFRPAA